jgi:galactose mutarotase-like enzyme
LNKLPRQGCPLVHLLAHRRHHPVLRRGQDQYRARLPIRVPPPIHNSAYFGEKIGRVANRIAGGIIQSPNKKSCTLVANDGPSALHGGLKGWSKKVWEGPELVGTRAIEGLNGKLERGKNVKFPLTSEDSDEGIPGRR